MLSAHTGAPPALPAPRLARLALRARRRGRAARPGRAPSAARSRPRAARSAPWRGRCAPRRLHAPPDNLRALPLGGGDVEDVVRCALLETLGATRASSPAEGEGGEGRSRHHDAQASGGNACVLPHSMCNASRRDAPLERERLPPRPGAPIPRTLSARAPRHAQWSWRP